MERNTARSARKRPVNLTLNGDLVKEAKAVTDNLSGVVESLLSEFVAKERERRISAVENARASVALWNAFTERHGSFADEYLTL